MNDRDIQHSQPGSVLGNIGRGFCTLRPQRLPQISAQYIPHLCSEVANSNVKSFLVNLLYEHMEDKGRIYLEARKWTNVFTAPNLKLEKSCWCPARDCVKSSCKSVRLPQRGNRRLLVMSFESAAAPMSNIKPRLQVRMQSLYYH